MKNTVYAFAPEHLTRSIEAFGLVLARHFVASPQVSTATITLREHRWEPLDGPDGPGARRVLAGRGGDPDGLGRRGARRIDARRVRRHRPDRDEDRRGPRSRASRATGTRRSRRRRTGSWPRRSPRPGATPDATADWDASYDAVLATLLAVFADHHSESVQHSIWLTGSAMLERHPEIDEVRMTMPNLHHWVVDLDAVRRREPRRDLRRDDRPARADRGDRPPRVAGTVSPHVDGVEVVGAARSRHRPGPDARRRSRSSPTCSAGSGRSATRSSGAGPSATRGSRAGERPAFLPETADVRAGDWRVAPAPADLDDRRVEITGPAETRMMINALNSGAKVFMADLEDALSPTWSNVVGGQVAIADAVRRTLALDTAEKSYRLNDTTATLVVRPRGWHLDERHVLVDGAPDVGQPVRRRPVPVPRRRRGARPRQRPVPVPAQAREPPRGAAVERRLRPRAGGRRDPAGVGAGHRPDRDHPRRVRDGRDPVRAARARRRAQRRAAGTTSSRSSSASATTRPWCCPIAAR